jgi:hypothetical protein
VLRSPREDRGPDCYLTGYINCGGLSPEEDLMHKALLLKGTCHAVQVLQDH